SAARARGTGRAGRAGLRVTGQQRERIQVGDAPPVDDLRTERDLVRTLEVALTVRVTELDHLEPDLTLDTPTHRVEVTRNSQEAVRLAHGVRRRRGERIESRDSRGGAELGEHLHAVVVAGGHHVHREGGGEG